MLMAVGKSDLECILGQAQPNATLEQPTSGWCMIVARPGMEQEGRDSLRRRGVGAWWPNYRKEVAAKDPQSGKRYKRFALAGVLPGIIFSPARIDHLFWSAIDLAPGVINAAYRSDGKMLLLSDTDIAMFHTIERGLNKPTPAKFLHTFKIGDKIRFCDDATQRFPLGLVSKCLRTGHLVVDVNMFGQSTPVTVYPHQIEMAA